MSRAPETLRFRAVDEPQPGDKWQDLFEHFWPSYRHWFLKEGDAGRPSYAASARALREHMPQLVPTYERVVDLAGGSDLAARFLSLYCPPPYLTACSQAIWMRDHCGAAVPAAPGAGETPAPQEVALIRNYDYGPNLCDGVILRSRWNQPVLAMTDCLWGVLDGINEAGVAVALAFGGRQAIGEGFGITIVLRYLLEMARNTAGAIEILQRVPVHMAYNVAIVDAEGSFATVFVGPDRPVVVSQDAASANHQRRIEWPRYEQRSESQKRLESLEERLADPAETLESLTRRFFEPPLFRTTYDRAWGTLYMAMYHPKARSV
ncbi:MAG: C45 family autoproteolytic acyltransferase/hydrolase, partial [Planctomycetota bacterium]